MPNDDTQALTGIDSTITKKPGVMNSDLQAVHHT